MPGRNPIGRLLTPVAADQSSTGTVVTDISEKKFMERSGYCDRRAEFASAVVAAVVESLKAFVPATGASEPRLS